MKHLLAGFVATWAALFTLFAGAITYGQPDGERHAQTGDLVGNFSSGVFPYCSGALISPTVFVTAAHCDLGNMRVMVTFDEKPGSGPFTVRHGTYFADPLYRSRQDDPHDLAVVVLDEPVLGITPARLPTAGLLDSLSKDQKITAAGYGGQEPVIVKGSGVVIAYQDNREYAVGTLNAINPAWLRVSQNPAKGDAGGCYGDSGGPNFLGGGSQETNILAAITITGDYVCRATNVVYRLDTPSARTFLGKFVTLP